MGQMIIEKDTQVDVIVKPNLNITVKIKYKTRVIENMCHGAFVNSWVPDLANLSKARTWCHFFSTNPMFSVLYVIFGRKISRKTSI